MEINWRAVLTGFVVAVVLGIVTAWIVPPDATSGFVQALPGLVGGFVAGYMVMDVGRGAVHGGLATIVGGLAVLAVVGALFTGLVPAIGRFTVGLVVLVALATPGAIAGALGGWAKRRRAEPRGPVAPGTP